MNSINHAAAKSLALFLVFAVSQIYVQANLNVSSPPPAANSFQGDQLTGKLTTRGNKPITINGNTGEAGTTVLSGSTLSTPDAIGATVQLGKLGTLDIAPNTVLSLTFDGSSITVNMTGGCAILTTNKGINGSVVTTQGTTERTDPSKKSSVDICTGIPGAPASSAAAAPIVNQGAAASAGAGSAGAGSAGAATAAAGGGAAGGAAAGGGGFSVLGLGTGASIALVSAAAAGVIGGVALANRGRPPCVPRGANPSPGTPCGRPCP